MENHELYDEDTFARAMLNAQLLREHKLAEIDAEDIAEELEGLARETHSGLADLQPDHKSHPLGCAERFDTAGNYLIPPFCS
jgi:hypothetical protein